MDSITHLALGATLGELMLGKQLGKKALAIGAIAQSVPDIDFVAAAWLTPAENLIAHRGFTHSLLFAGMVSLFLALIADRWHRRRHVFLGNWWIFFAVQLCVHLFIDGFNAYGVGWLEPFSHLRFSFNTLFVADPFFSFGVGLASAVLIFLKRHHFHRTRWAILGIGLSAAYLAYSVVNKITIDQSVRSESRLRGFNTNRYFTTPTPLNNWLWYVVVEDQNGFQIGYRSVFDNQLELKLEYFPKNDSLLNRIHDHESLQRLIRFSQGYYTVALVRDTLVFNDLRFGQVGGWQNPRAPFVFHYYLDHPEENTLLIQRGRFAGWNTETVRSLCKRIKGN